MASHLTLQFILISTMLETAQQGVWRISLPPWKQQWHTDGEGCMARHLTLRTPAYTCIAVILVQSTTWTEGCQVRQLSRRHRQRMAKLPMQCTSRCT